MCICVQFIWSLIYAKGVPCFDFNRIKSKAALMRRKLWSNTIQQ